MKTAKLSFDLSDKPRVAEMLRVWAAEKRISQKAIIVEALEAYFADKLETRLLSRAAERVFSEWDNDDDRVYDDL